MNWSKSQIVKQNQVSIVLKGNRYYCRRCFTISPSIRKYQNHSKSCKKVIKQLEKQQEVLSLRQKVKNTVQQPSTIEETNATGETILQKIESSLIKAFQAIAKNCIWNYQNFNPPDLLSLALRKMDSINQEFKHLIDHADFQSLKKDPLCRLVILESKDVFDVRTIQQRLEDVPNKTNKYLIINKINLVRKKYGLEVMKNERVFNDSKDTRPIIYFDFIQFVLKLFQTKVRQYIHIALDLLIMFQSCERFPSSIVTLPPKINLLINQARQKKHVRITSTKTAKTTELVLSERLVNLLLEFGWTDFCFKKHFYKNMYQVFNFTCYHIRRGTIIQLRQYIKNVDVSAFTRHSVRQNADYYIKFRTLQEKYNFVNSLVIPFNLQELNAILNVEVFAKVIPHLKKDFIKNPIKLDFWKHERFSQYELISMVEEQEQEQDKEGQKNQKLYIHAEGDHNKSDNLLEQDKQKNQAIIIEGVSYEQIQGNFNLSKLFNQEEDQKQACFVCQEVHCQIYCRFCLKNFHVNCIDVFCICMAFNTKIFGIDVEKISKKKLEVLMPSQYIDTNQRLFHNFRFLMHLRGFHVTNGTVDNSAHQPKIYTQENDFPQAILSYYDKYILGKYFPPLKVLQSGEKNKFGTGVGVFACQKIEPNTFIGEYGGDVFDENRLICNKRQDMNMKLIYLAQEKKEYIIGAIEHTSYVQLVNSSKKPNCKIVQCVFNNKLKIILITTSLIDCGQELVYDYLGSFDTKFQERLRPKVKSIANETSKPKSKPKKRKIVEIIQQQINIQPFMIDPEQNLERQKEGEIHKKPDKQHELEWDFDDFTIVPIENQYNNCFLASLIQFIQPIVQPILGINCYSLYSQKLSLFLTGSQEDPNQVMSLLSDQLLDSSVSFLFQQSSSCSICKKKKNDHLIDHQLRLIFEDNLTNSMKKNARINRENFCQTCKANTIHKGSIKYTFQQFLIVCLNNFKFDKEKQASSTVRQTIKINKLSYNEFRPLGLISHVGGFIGLDSYGHYTCSFVKGNRQTVVDGANVRTGSDKASPCMILLKTLQDGTFAAQSNGVFYVFEKITMKKNAASFVKLLIFVVFMETWSNMEEEHEYTAEIDALRTFEQSTSNLAIGQFYTVKQLLKFICEQSGCDAARLLCRIYQQKFSRPMKNCMTELCQRIGVSESIVGDCVGLNSNLSTVKESLSIFNYVTKLPNWQFYFQEVSENNTNKLVKDGYLGKTGSSRAGYNFVGVKKNIFVCVMEEISRQSLWRKVKEIYELCQKYILVRQMHFREMQKQRKKREQNKYLT